MATHGNTLYVTTQGAYVGKDHQTVRVKVEGKVRLTVPLHHLEGIVCFGRVGVSPALFGVCAERALAISFLSEHGRYLARVEPPAHGNVLLRREQYRIADDPARCLKIARPIVAAKIQNARNLLLRSAREAEEGERSEGLKKAATHMAAVLEGLPGVASLDGARGIEGETARTYFDALPLMIRQAREHFPMNGRSRRPPRDPVNALLSFLYGLVRHDCAGALQSVGLDPAVGFLHADRPGRLSLALDLMEEFRPLVADRLVLALINPIPYRSRLLAGHAGGRPVSSGIDQSAASGTGWFRYRPRGCRHLDRPDAADGVDRLSGAQARRGAAPADANERADRPLASSAGAALGPNHPRRTDGVPGVGPTLEQRH